MTEQTVKLKEDDWVDVIGALQFNIEALKSCYEEERKEEKEMVELHALIGSWEELKNDVGKQTGLLK